MGERLDRLDYQLQILRSLTMRKQNVTRASATLRQQKRDAAQAKNKRRSLTELDSSLLTDGMRSALT